MFTKFTQKDETVQEKISEHEIEDYLSPRLAFTKDLNVIDS